MDLSQEGDDLLQIFTAPPAKKSRSNTPRTEKGTTGASRVEKGTHLVNPHQVAEVSPPYCPTDAVPPFFIIANNTKN